MNALAFAQVEDFYGIFAQRADEQSLAGHIDIEVIDPSFYSGQRDCLR